MKVLDSNGTSFFTVHLPCNKVSTSYDTCLEETGVRQIIVENSTFLNNAPTYDRIIFSYKEPSPILYLNKDSGNAPVNYTIKDSHFYYNAYPGPLMIKMESTLDIHVDMNILDTQFVALNGWCGLSVTLDSGEATIHSNIEGCT